MRGGHQVSDLVILPDSLRLVTSFLRAQPELTAVVSDRVYTVIPEAKTWPMVRVTAIGGETVHTRPWWLEQPLFQVEAFGGPQKQARDVANLCRSLLAERVIGTHDEGVVTDVSVGGLADIPDDTFTPAKHRTLFTAELTVHP